LIQEFFARLLDKKYLRLADSDRGKFRAFPFEVAQTFSGQVGEGEDSVPSGFAKRFKRQQNGESHGCLPRDLGKRATADHL
jgi:hypothetical protein